MQGVGGRFLSDSRRGRGLTRVGGGGTGQRGQEGVCRLGGGG